MNVEKHLVWKKYGIYQYFYNIAIIENIRVVCEKIYGKPNTKIQSRGNSRKISR